MSYAGKGYSPAFVANFDAIAARICAGEAIEIIAGPDDICAPLLADTDPHCFKPSVVERDELASRDVAALLGTRVSEGTTMVLDGAWLKSMREAFARRSIRAACSGCEWHTQCTEIAGSGYAGTRASY